MTRVSTIFIPLQLLHSSLTALAPAGHIEWISKALSKALDLAPPDVEIAIRIFVTAKTAALPGAETEPASQQWNEDDSVHSSEGTSQEGKAAAPSLLHYPAVQVAQGRPDLPVILREEVDANRGRMSVTGAFVPLLRWESC